MVDIRFRPRCETYDDYLLRATGRCWVKFGWIWCSSFGCYTLSPRRIGIHMMRHRNHYVHEMTSSTEPEVNNYRNAARNRPSHGHRRRIYNRKVAGVRPCSLRDMPADGRTDRQRDRRSHRNTSHPSRGERLTGISWRSWPCEQLPYFPAHVTPLQVRYQTSSLLIQVTMAVSTSVRRTWPPGGAVRSGHDTATVTDTVSKLSK